jgi:hypothetical protein
MLVCLVVYMQWPQCLDISILGVLHFYSNVGLAI